MKKFFKFEFFQNVLKDFKSITWIGKKDLFSLLVIVFLSVFVCSVVVLGVDYVFHKVLRFLINL